MAHADYDCCAICDSKMNYNGGDASTKEAICPSCIECSAELGKLCVRPAQVIEHLAGLSDAEALKWLHAMGFSACYYQNPLDDYLIERGLIETGSKHASAKWGRRLKEIAA